MGKTVIRESTKFFSHEREMYKFAETIRGSWKYKVIKFGKINNRLYFVKYKNREV